jgi:hypothetical protein
MDIKSVGICGLDSPCTGYGQLAGRCEHGDETSGSIKGGEFIDYLSVLFVFKDSSLCSWMFFACCQTLNS